MGQPKGLVFINLFYFYCPIQSFEVRLYPICSVTWPVTWDAIRLGYARVPRSHGAQHDFFIPDLRQQ